MILTTEVKLRPFIIPNFVLAELPPRPREDGFKEGLSFPLCELSPEVLSGLCDEFRAAVFAKAEKKDPKKWRTMN